MTQCNTLNAKMPNSQLNKLKSRTKHSTKVTLNISSNVVGNSNDESNFLHNLLLTDIQVSRLCKTFENGSSVNLKHRQNLLVIQMKKTGLQSRTKYLEQNGVIQ